MAFGDLKGGTTFTGAANSITNPFSATGSIAVNIGDLIYAVLAQQTALTVTACADNLGNSYTATNAGTLSGIISGRAFYSRVSVAGTLTSVSFTTTASANNVAAVVAVFEGPFDSSPLDANPANLADNTSPFSGNATGTLSQSAELVITWAADSNGLTWAATSPNLLGPQIASQAVAGARIGYQTVSATTTVTPAFTGTNPTNAVVGTNSFKQDLNIQRFQNTQVLSRIISRRRLYARSGSRNFSITGDRTPAAVDTSRARSPFFLGRTILGPRYRDLSKSTPYSTIDFNLSPSLYTDDDTFYTQVVTAESVDLSPVLYVDDDTFYTHTITTEGSLTLALYVDGDTFYSATVEGEVEPVTRTPNPLHRRFPSIRNYNRNFSIVSSTIVSGDVDLTPSLYVDDDIFYTATIEQETTETVRGIFLLHRLLPSIRVHNRNFNIPTPVETLDIDLVPDLYVDDDTFYNVTITTEGGLSADLYVDDDTFYTHTISIQAVNVRSPFYIRRIISRRAIGHRDINQSQTDVAVNLSPSLFVNDNTFYSQTIALTGFTNYTTTLVIGRVQPRRRFLSVSTPLSTLPSDQDLLPSLFINDNTFYNPTVIQTGFTNYTTTLVIGRVQPRRRFLSVSTPLSTVLFDQNLTTSLYIDGDNFYSPTVASTYDLAPSLYTDADTFYTQTVLSIYDLQPTLFIDGDTFYSLDITVGAVDVAPNLYTDIDIFYTIVLASGDIDILPNLYIDDDTFYTHTITGGTIDIAPSLYVDDDTFYTVTITVTYELLPALYIDADTFYTHTITADVVNLTPSLYVDDDTFYTHTITAGAVDLTLSLYIDGDTFYSPNVVGGTTNITLSLYVDDDTFYNSTIISTNNLTLSLYTDADTFYTHTAASTYNLSTSLYIDTDTFYELFLSGGTKELFPSLFENTNTFYQASLAGPQEEIPGVVFGGFGSGPPRRVQKRDVRVQGIIFIRTISIIPGHAVTLSFIPGSVRVDTVPELKPFINTIKFRLPIIGEGFGDNFAEDNLDELLLLISNIFVESDDE